jgi:hypothetical protein
MVWHAVGYHPHEGFAVPTPEDAAIKRLRAETRVLEAMKARMHPGMVLVMTDLPAHAETRTGTDFVIMTEDTA